MPRRRPRPLKAKLPGQKAGPTKNQQRKPPKRPWDRAVKTAQEASSWLNPFD